MYSTEEVAELLGLFDTSMYLGGMGYMLGRYSNVRRDTFFMKGLGGNFMMTFFIDSTDWGAGKCLTFLS